MKIICYSALWLCGLAHAALPDSGHVPKAADAVRWSMDANGSSSADLLPELLPGIYLYRDKLHITAFDPKSGKSLPLRSKLPAGTVIDDPTFGRVAVLQSLIPIPLRIAEPAVQAHFHIEWQACYEPAGICYPPQATELLLPLKKGASSVAAKPLFGGKP